MSDYEDGAFYWVRDGYEWSVACFIGDGYDKPWTVVASAVYFATSDFSEIGPRIGKEPPKPRAARKVEARPRTSAELDKALGILLGR